MQTNEKASKFIISLDFELRFGVHDLYGSNLSGYETQLSHEVEASEIMLDHFSKNKIRATWATVGALACESWDEYFERSPTTPNYRLDVLKIQKNYAQLDPKGRLHFCPKTVKRIAETEGQDLGSHTFSHLFLQEEGVTEYDFLQDAKAVEKIFTEKFNVTPVSLVFPRNQFNFLNSFSQTSYRIWRGNEKYWFFDCNSKKNNTLFPRALRLADAINPYMSYPDVSNKADVTNSSQFLRFNLPEAMWKLHMAKLVHGVKSLKNGENFHLWWHPHNLGGDLKRSEKRLKQVIEVVKHFESSGKIQSSHMRDLVHE